MKDNDKQRKTINVKLDEDVLAAVKRRAKENCRALRREIEVIVRDAVSK